MESYKAFGITGAPEGSFHTILGGCGRVIALLPNLSVIFGFAGTSSDRSSPFGAPSNRPVSHTPALCFPPKLVFEAWLSCQFGRGLTFGVYGAIGCGSYFRRHSSKKEGLRNDRCARNAQALAYEEEMRFEKVN